jgi:hypothetical protein
MTTEQVNEADAVGAIREALKAGPTERAWHLYGEEQLVGNPRSSDGQHMLYVGCIKADGLLGDVAAIQSADHVEDGITRNQARANAMLIAACSPSAIAALLKERDAMAERVEELLARLEEVEKALTGLLAIHTEPAGMTPEIVRDKEAFSAFMETSEAKVKAAIESARAALSSKESANA